MLEETGRFVMPSLNLTPMTNIILLQIDDGSVVILVVRGLLQLAGCLIVATVLFCLIYFGTRNSRRRAPIRAVAKLLLLCAVLAWLVHFASTADLNLTKITLNSEEDRVAEKAYLGLSNLDLQTTIEIARDAGEPGNVRFYCACHIADLLSTKSDADIELALHRIAGAPTIQTSFFGTNGINSSFFAVGSPQPKLSIAHIIEQRLEDVKQPERAQFVQKKIAGN